MGSCVTPPPSSTLPPLREKHLVATPSKARAATRLAAAAAKAAVLDRRSSKPKSEPEYHGFPLRPEAPAPKRRQLAEGLTQGRFQVNETRTTQPLPVTAALRVEVTQSRRQEIGSVGFATGTVATDKQPSKRKSKPERHGSPSRPEAPASKRRQLAEGPTQGRLQVNETRTTQPLPVTTALPVEATQSRRQETGSVGFATGTAATEPTALQDGQYWPVPNIPHQSGLPSGAQINQHQWDWTSTDRGMATHPLGPGPASNFTTLAPTLTEPPMPWYTQPNQGKTDHKTSFTFGHESSPPASQAAPQTLPYMTSNFVAHSGSPNQRPSPETVTCPINLDGGTESAMPGPFTDAQRLPPQMPSNGLAYTPLQLDQNKENVGLDFVPYLPPGMPSGNVGQEPSPPLSHPNGANPHPTMASWSYPALNAQYYQGAVTYPYMYVNDGPFATWPQQYPYPPINAPPSITKRPAEMAASGAQARDPASKPQVPTDEPLLCPEQAALVDLIVQGHNVFYTGSAGCGKSTVLRAFVRRLKELGKNVKIVAPTGRAALNVGGCTTWTFAGWTPDSHKKPLQRLRDEASFGKMASKRIKETDVLVIDEISMVENLHLERLNEVMKSARRSRHPFGGCQIVVTGDFCQLPPVKPFRHCLECGRELNEKIGPDGDLVYECKRHGTHADKDKWAFRSRAWEECGFKHIYLRTIHRQNDQTFIQMLQKCRLGEQLTEAEISLLMNHKARVSQATKLFCTRKEADDVNKAAFDKIMAPKHTYWAHDTFLWRQERHPRLERYNARSEWLRVGSDAPPKDKKPLQALDQHRFSQCVQLKRGGLVVLLANLDLSVGLCNGSQGVICGFEALDPAMMPTRDTREELSAGPGQRIRTVKVVPKPGQRVLRGDYAALQEREIQTFITSSSAPARVWPVVRFHNGVVRTVYGECSVAQVGDEEPYSLLARTQLPLAPAWAMTIHKSQSLTLDRVIVNLDRAFEEGQVYVALSRATGLDGLKIEGDGAFLRDKAMVNADVAAFLRERFGAAFSRAEETAEDGDLGEEKRL